jgi:hypothetical protein
VPDPDTEGLYAIACPAFCPSKKGRLGVRACNERLDAWRDSDMFSEASLPGLDVDVDGKNIYARLGFFGDRSIDVGLYGSDCDAVACMNIVSTAHWR